MKYHFIPKGVCSTKIEVEIENDRIQSVRFIGGCPGNQLGIAALVQGMPVEEAIKRMKGIRCGKKITSCPDQLALALTKARETIINKGDEKNV